ncbi:hypothetical protein BDF14DRAFT_1843415 [Spinellus fusiger]|nr:hypothetical protein BDF14DRAFT_1843415 [Spinellus fusiger]
MGRKATYAIGFTKRSPCEQEIKNKKQYLKECLARGEDMTAAHVSLDIADLYLEQCDEIDPEMPLVEQEKDLHKFLQSALNYCKTSCATMHQQQQDIGLIRGYQLMIQCYQKENNYAQGIETCNLLLLLLTGQRVKDLNTLQTAYKALADIYFTRGHDPEEGVFSDLENAWTYYQEERKVLSSIHVEEGEEEKRMMLRTHIRSSSLNLGIISAKLPIHTSQSEKYFADAIRQAQSLKDIQNERLSWWEFGNMYRYTGHLEGILQCQKKELSLITKHQLKEDELACRIENIKVYLEKQDLSKCIELCGELGDRIHSHQEKMYSAILNLVLDVQAKINDIKALPQDTSPETLMRRAKIYIELGQMYYEESMSYAVVKIADQANTELFCQDPMEEMLRPFQVDILQLKASAKETMVGVSMNEHSELNREILSIIKIHIKSPKQRLEYSIAIYDRLSRISEYYGRQIESKRWQQVALEAEKEYEQLDDEINQAMDDDEEEEEEEKNEVQDVIMKEPLQTLDSTMNRTATESVRPVLKSVRVFLMIYNREEKVYIPCRNEKNTVGWLIERVTAKAWKHFGHEPCINYLHMKGAVLAPTDLVMDIKNSATRIDAMVEGFNPKTLAEYYENACFRMKMPIKNSIVKALRDQKEHELVLKGLGISSQDIPLLRVLLKNIEPLTHLNLAANLLYDKDIEALFETVSPFHLDLSNNLLTVQSLKMLSQRCGSGLITLRMDYTFLNADISTLQSMMASLFPNLKSMSLEGCYE